MKIPAQMRARRRAYDIDAWQKTRTKNPYWMLYTCTERAAHLRRENRMPESFWESNVAVENAPQTESVQATEAQEPQPAVSLSADEFSALEERVLRTVQLVKTERDAHASAAARAAAAEEQVRDQSIVLDQLQKEMDTLRDERDHVRKRIEQLLSQLDSLEL